MNEIDPMPGNASVILSPFCDNNCIFCRNQPRCSVQELYEQEAKVYRNAAYHREQGAESIEISGGDPGEYEALPQLVSDLKTQGFKTVRLATNGVRCADASRVKALAEAGLDIVRIPLYGATAEVHEAVARNPGAFRAVMQALALFREQGVGIELHSLIVRQNRESLPELHRLMTRMTHWRHCSFSVPCLAGDDRSFYVPINDLARDCLPLIYWGTMHDCPPAFYELPQCVFGFEYPFIRRGSPPRQGLQQPPEAYRSSVTDVPTYRLKRKPPMCATCRKTDECDGFFANDLDRYGSGSLAPFC